MPECSCQHCLEAMLREFGPAMIAEEIRITRVTDGGEEPGTTERREAA